MEPRDAVAITGIVDGHEAAVRAQQGRGITEVATCEGELQRLNGKVDTCKEAEEEAAGRKDEAFRRVEQAKNQLLSVQGQKDAACGTAGASHLPDAARSQAQGQCTSLQGQAQASEAAVAIAEQAYHVLRQRGAFLVWSPYEGDLFFPNLLKKVFGKVKVTHSDPDSIFWSQRDGERADCDPISSVPFGVAFGE